MATNQKTISVTAGDSIATTTTKLTDSLPGIACPDPAGYKYVGARYVPLFADPIEWDETMQTTYEPLTIVLYQGNSYTSKQYVPVGIDITNEEYWAETGNYNAQIEEYRKEVEAVKESIDEINTNIDEIEDQLKDPQKAHYGFAIALQSPFNTEDSVKTRIDNAYAAGANNVCICVYISDDTISYSDITNYAIEYATSLEMGYSIKVHGYTTNPEDYANVVLTFFNEITTKPETIFVYNEPSTAYIQTNEQNMLQTINTLKIQGYEVGVSFNMAALMYGSTIIEAANIVGINMYPSMGYSLTYSVESMQEALSNTFTRLTQGIDKTIWITETGILPYKCFLFAPELYDLEDGYPPDSTIGRTIDYNVSTSYYRAAIKALCESCDNLVLWYTETSLTSENAPYIRSV